MQYNEYYPYGLQTATSWTRGNATGNNFLGNGGTELNSTTSLYDLEYRNYDPALARMHQVDPMADKYASYTPYNYSFNAPSNFNDVNGADPFSSDQYWKEESVQRKRAMDLSSMYVGNSMNSNGRVFGQSLYDQMVGAMTISGFSNAYNTVSDFGVIFNNVWGGGFDNIGGLPNGNK